MRRLPALLLTLLPTLPLALLWTASAQTPIEVAVGNRSLGEVPPLATAGFNFGNSMRVVGFEDEFGAVRVASLRFPPGNQADEIALGRADLEALALNLELLSGPPVLMVTNLFRGTPEGAAELARLAEEMAIPILAWEIGNEPDLYAVNRNDRSWTPDRYCREFRRFGEALRAVNPEYLLAGPAVSGARPRGEEYLRDVLRLCGDAIDILTWHIYPTDGTWPQDRALATSGQLSEEFERYRRWAGDPAFNPLGFNEPPRFGVSEFGLSWRSSSFRHLEDMVATVWLADVLGQMSSERLDMSHYFTLQAMGGHGLIDVGGWVRPTYHLYRMLADFRGEVLRVAAQPPLRGYAVGDDERLQILLVNPHGETQSVALQLPLWAGKSMETEILDQDSYDRLGGTVRAALPATEPITVPSLGIVLVTVPVDHD